MKRYIIVAHNWFVSSKGFDVIESDAKTLKEAQNEAYAFKGRHETTFNKMDVKVLEILDKETVESNFESKLAKHNNFRRVTFWDFLLRKKARFEK
jgi:hypothetical protein